MLLGDVGSTLSAIEWLTRGRYRLAPLGLGLAVATFFGSVASTVAALARMYHGLAESPALLADQAAYHHAVASGMWGLLGGLALGAEFAAFQMLLWAAARRRTLRAEQSAAQVARRVSG
jgi:hypothetical protein